MDRIFVVYVLRRRKLSLERILKEEEEEEWRGDRKKGLMEEEEEEEGRGNKRTAIYLYTTIHILSFLTVS